MAHTGTILLSAMCGCLLLLQGRGRCDLVRVPDEDITPPPLAVNSNGWRPVLPSSEKTTISPSSNQKTTHPVLSKFQAHMQTAERNKRFQVTGPAPPSILGSFSVFGHATVKTRDNKKMVVTDHLMPPPLQAAESSHQFRYERPSEEQRHAYYVLPPKTKTFFPSQQIGEFPEGSSSYSTIREEDRFQPYYKGQISSFGGPISHTSTKFGDGDVKYFPQSVGIQVSGQIHDVLPYEQKDYKPHKNKDSGNSYSLGTNLSNNKRPSHATHGSETLQPTFINHGSETIPYILPGSTPLTTYDEQVYVTTWPSEHQEMAEQQYFSKRPIEKYRPYFREEFKKQRPYETQASFLPTQSPSSQTYLRNPHFSEETTDPPSHLNEVHQRKPLLPTPVTEEEPSNNLYLFPNEQESQKISEDENREEYSRKPAIRRPSLQRRPTYIQKQEERYTDRHEESYNQKLEERYRPNRRPSNYHRKQPNQEEQKKQRRRRPTTEIESTTIFKSTEEEEEIPPTPIPMLTPTFHSRKRLPINKDKTRSRLPASLLPQSTTESHPSHDWDTDDYVYDPEFQSTSNDFDESHTLNEVTDDDFVSTKSVFLPTGSTSTSTSTTSTTTTTTTTTTTPPPPLLSPSPSSSTAFPSTTSTEATSKLRPRLRYNTNSTRPRFSVKDYRERLNRLSSLTKTSETENSDITKSKQLDSSRTRTRGVSYYNNSKQQQEEVHEAIRSRTRQEEIPDRTRNRNRQEETPELSRNRNRQEEISDGSKNRNRQEEITDISRNRNRQEDFPDLSRNRNRQEEVSDISRNRNRQEETSDVNLNKYRQTQRFSSQRQRTAALSSLTTTSTTTTEAPITTFPSTSTERINTFKPSNSRYRPGASKYYNRNRFSTTEADSEDSPSSTTLRTVIKPKPIYSVTRKPYPLRSRYSPRVSSTTEQTPPAEEFVTISIKPINTTESSSLETVNTKFTETEDVPVMSEKSDTTTISAEEEKPAAPVTEISNSEQDTLSPSQIVADLTSSASSGGYFKTVAPASSLSNLRITMATEDPILPIEAFFPVRSSREVRKS